MTGWIKVDDLKPTARTLALGAEGIEDASTNAPAVPNAGSSSGALGGAMVSMFGAVAKLATGMATAADTVEAADANFKTADQTNATNIGKAGAQPPQPSGGK